MKPENERYIAMTSLLAGIDASDALHAAQRLGFFAIEWLNDVTTIPLSHQRKEERKRLLLEKEDLTYSFHSSFTNIDLAVKDSSLREACFTILKSEVEFVQDAGGKVLVLHFQGGGLADEESDVEKGLKQVEALAELAEKKDVFIAVENLRSGFTSNPENLLEFTKMGCKITIDVGHLFYYVEDTKERTLLSLDFITKIQEHIIHSHIYEREQDKPVKHLAPSDDSYLKPIITKLCHDTPCLGFTIEYWEDEESVLKIRKILEECL